MGRRNAMDALVITLREGLEAALVIGIIYALVKRAGRSDLMRWVIAGAVSAGVFSVGAAVALGALGLSAENPIVEGVTYLVAGVAVASMVVWMWRNGRSIRGKVESRVEGIVTAEKSSSAAGIGLFALSFFMVAREGVETVLFLSASVLGGANQVGLLVGGLAGLALAVTYGVLFARGSVRMDLKLFFTLTSAVLLLLSVKLLGSSIHEFEEAGVLAMSETMAHLFDWIHETPIVDWLFLAALAVPLLAPLVRRTGGGSRPEARLGSN
jgi:high-affinity iron transporter